MENVNEFLKEVIAFQEFAANRGYELIMALGCKRKMYTTPDNFEFEEDGVVMRFGENTNHDSPDYESICLKTEELEKTDEEWSAYIELTKKQTSEKQEKKRQDEENRKLETKRKQFESLKKLLLAKQPREDAQPQLNKADVVRSCYLFYNPHYIKPVKTSSGMELDEWFVALWCLISIVMGYVIFVQVARYHSLQLKCQQYEQDLKVLQEQGHLKSSIFWSTQQLLEKDRLK